MKSCSPWGAFYETQINSLSCIDLIQVLMVCINV